MCLNNCIKSIVPDINYDPLEISCFNPVYKDTCDYIKIDETCHLSAKEEDLVFLQFNCRGLFGNQCDLSRFPYDIIGERKVDVIALVETWLTKESLKRVNLLGFKFAGIQRGSKKGGEVGFLIQEEINYIHKADLDIMLNHLESFTVELILPKCKLLVTSMYRPPNTDEKLFLCEYNEHVKKLKNSGKKYIIGLDHNLNLLNYEHHSATRKFLELMIENEQLPCITRPTRLTHHSATLIDNVLVSKKLYPLQHSSIVISDISDHLPCLTVFENIKGKDKGKTTITIWNLGEKKISQIAKKLASYDLYLNLNVPDLNTAFEILHSKITKCIDEVSPKKEIPVSTNRTHCEPWMSKGL